MSAIQLPDLINALNYQYIHNPVHNMQIEGISCDSRQVKPGYLFAAVRGQNHDGHRYISEALGKGASAVIAEERPAMDLPETAWIQVADSRLALARVAAMFYRHPGRELSLIGVTGTSGKTTTTSLLHHIYNTAGLNSGLIGTVNIHCNRQSWLAKMTTPDALELQGLLRLMADSGVSHAVMEVSSHGLSQKRVDELLFRGAVFTNISPNHLDFHQNLKDYARAKGRLASLVQDGGFVLINGDDAYFRNLQPPKNVSSFFLGTHNYCNLLIKNVVLGKKGSSFELKIQHPEEIDKIGPLKKHAFSFQIPLLGRHNIFNAASAASAALLQEIPEETIAKGLASFPGVERRLQLHSLGDLQVIDDTVMCPGSIDAMFKTLQEISFSYNNIIAVYALRGSRGVQVNEDNGRALARWVKTLNIKYFFSTISINHADDQHTVLQEEEKAFLQGARSVGISPLHFADLEEAIGQAVKAASPGTILLLLGAQGMDAGLNILLEQVPWEKAALSQQ